MNDRNLIAAIDHLPAYLAHNQVLELRAVGSTPSQSCFTAGESLRAGAMGNRRGSRR